MTPGISTHQISGKTKRHHKIFGFWHFSTSYTRLKWALQIIIWAKSSNYLQSSLQIKIRITRIRCFFYNRYVILGQYFEIFRSVKILACTFCRFSTTFHEMQQERFCCSLILILHGLAANNSEYSIFVNRYVYRLKGSFFFFFFLIKLHGEVVKWITL